MSFLCSRLRERSSLTACIKERSEGTVEQRCRRYTLIKMNNVIILLPLHAMERDGARTIRGMVTKAAASLAGWIGAIQNCYCMNAPPLMLRVAPVM